MSAALSYPGVYVQEIPSGVRTISAVATSVTAFIGRSARGPVNVATTINSFADFERIFGGLWSSGSLGFAVRDFFVNGGVQAIITRLYHADPGDGTTVPLTIQPLTVGALKFVAATEGRWGLALRVDVDTTNLSADAAASLGVQVADLFNVTARDTSPGGRTERHVNLTVKDTARRVDKVLSANSTLIRYDGTPNPAGAIAAGSDALGTKEAAYAAAKKALSDKLIADPQANVTTEQAAVTTAKAGLDDALTKASQALSDGLVLRVADFLPPGGETNKLGLYALEQVDLFNLLCLPPYRAATDAIDFDPSLITAAAAYCERRRAMLIVDAPKDWGTKDQAKTKFMDPNSDAIGARSRNAALFFPRLQQPNPLKDNQIETFAACGSVAGIFARTDATRGVWKAPAGLDATLNGTSALSVPLTDAENGELNPLGINCLRAFPAAGRVVWGARTLRGNDQLSDEYKYIPVRRTALLIEESLYRGLQWVVFEPNDEPLWAQIRLNVGAFMQDMFRHGAFQGSAPRDAYFVKCDKDTTTQSDINLGIVNIVVGFAPLKPAEFVVIKLQQMAGQIDT
jgi:phage tail sheath protein FI